MQLRDLSPTASQCYVDFSVCNITKSQSDLFSGLFYSYKTCGTNVETYVQPISAVVSIGSTANTVEQVLSSGAMYLDSSDLELCEDEGVQQLVAVRIPRAGLPAGATLISARLLFIIDEVHDASQAAIIVAIRAQASASSAGFSSLPYDVSRRTTTSTNVTWAVPISVIVSEVLRTPDISPLLNELLGIPGWSESSPVVFTFERVAGEGIRWLESSQATSSGVLTPALELSWLPFSPPPPVKPPTPPAPPSPPLEPSPPSFPPSNPRPPFYPGGFDLVSTENGLRKALANFGGPGVVPTIRVFVPSGWTIDLSAPLVVDGLTVDLVSDGAGVLLRAINQSRVFIVRNGARLNLRLVSLCQGYAASGDGGALLISESSHVSLTNGSVTDSSAPSGFGGCIHVSGLSTLALTGVELRGCHANSGGSISASSGAQVTAMLASIISSRAEANGGSVEAKGSNTSVILTQSSIRDSRAGIAATPFRPRGGAIYVNTLATVILDHVSSEDTHIVQPIDALHRPWECQVATRLQVAASGGFLKTKSAYARLYDCHICHSTLFTSSQSSDAGGAISGHGVIVHKCKFTNCSSCTSGAVHHGSGQFVNSTFQSVSATVHGAAIFFDLSWHSQGTLSIPVGESAFVDLLNLL